MNTQDENLGDSFAAPARSAIPAIESAVLNIKTAMSDCASARNAWIKENWNDATMWISNAMFQLESAKAKIHAHQEAGACGTKDAEDKKWWVVATRYPNDIWRMDDHRCTLDEATQYAERFAKNCVAAKVVEVVERMTTVKQFEASSHIDSSSATESA